MINKLIASSLSAALFLGIHFETTYAFETAYHYDGESTANLKAAAQLAKKYSNSLIEDQYAGHSMTSPYKAMGYKLKMN